MARMDTHAGRVGPLVALLALPVAAVAIYAGMTVAKGHPPLQQIANEAAIAGVHALAASDHRTAEGCAAASTVAARRVIGDRPAMIRAVTPSYDKLTVSVELIDPATNTEATATARYVPPSTGLAPQKAAAVSNHASPPAHRF
ncbi:hypothetical protein RPB_3154 [Rhodopseudomonas palustris HaA2]|uniref:Uncharacterized protein n=1 Tax=Rhodopseudomonas palustris (strain HaA2) TaxID=316058 RepID=Q2IVB0_RHOP2|nr:hypothetical protein [Rhodopseudomonas palustris]ABD07850.1 hypothetical protein RPB_3154 [Rhodopseudomonas palustris HaA2]